MPWEQKTKDLNPSWDERPGRDARVHLQTTNLLPEIKEKFRLIPLGLGIVWRVEKEKAERQIRIDYEYLVVRVKTTLS